MRGCIGQESGISGERGTLRAEHDSRILLPTEGSLATSHDQDLCSTLIEDDADEVLKAQFCEFESRRKKK